MRDGFNPHFKQNIKCPCLGSHWQVTSSGGRSGISLWDPQMILSTIFFPQENTFQDDKNISGLPVSNPQWKQLDPISNINYSVHWWNWPCFFSRRNVSIWAYWGRNSFQIVHPVKEGKQAVFYALELWSLPEGAQGQASWPPRKDCSWCTYEGRQRQYYPRLPQLMALALCPVILPKTLGVPFPRGKASAAQHLPYQTWLDASGGFKPKGCRL